MNTKKFISVLSLTLGLFVSMFAFTACGSDDEHSSGGNDGSGSSNTPQSSKHVTKVITEEGNTIYEGTLTYDSQGRVIKIIETRSGTGTNSHSEMTYQYGETLIVTKEVEEGTYSNGQSFSRSESHSYTLENGRIVKDEEKQNGNSSSDTFSYDSDNHLSSIGSKIITWSDENLTKLGSRIYSYSNYSWVKGYPLYLDGSNTDAILFANGYYGIIPKNLPSKTYTSETNGWTYDYTFEGTCVTKVVTTPFVETNKTHKTTITYVWE